MKLFEIKKIKGTYAGMKFDDKTINNINKLCDKFDIKNRTPNQDLHTTLLFSRKFLPDYLPLGKLDDIITANASRCSMWPTQGDNPKIALVLKFNSPELVKRHKELMDEHKGTYDFPRYAPHLTLSYDCGKDFDLKTMNNYIKSNTFEIVMNEEYKENLNLDWIK